MTGALNDNPVTPNYLSPINFRMHLQRAPNVNFMIQKVVIPGLNLRPTRMPTPYLSMPEPGEHLTYNELDVTFKVDEEMANYLEIYKWIKDLGTVGDDYRALVQDNRLGFGKKSEIDIYFLSSSRNMIFTVNFQDCFPVALSNVYLDATREDVEFVTVDASFFYLRYDITQNINP